MSVASCSSCSICLRTRWISLDTSPNLCVIQTPIQTNRQANISARTRASDHTEGLELTVSERSLRVLVLPREEEEVEVDGLGSVATARTRGNCPRRWRWRRPGSAGRCATRPKPPQCRRCGAAAPPRRLLDSATSHAASLEKIAREKGRGKSSLWCAKEEDARQGGYADGESADLCARWPIFFRVLKD